MAYNKKKSLYEGTHNERYCENCKKALNKNDYPPIRRKRPNGEHSEELLLYFTEREKELNNMFVEKFGYNTENIYIDENLINFGQSEAYTIGFCIINGLVYLINEYKEYSTIRETCDVDEIEDDEVYYDEPIMCFDIIKTWCDKTEL